MSGVTIDPRAVVSSEAQIGEGTIVGPFSVIGPKVRMGRDCRVMSHVVIDGNTEIGDRCAIFPFASVGLPPQDLKYKGEPTRLVVGSDNVIRESVTLNIGTAGGGGLTKIGDRNLLMAGTHIAHDCVVGSGIIFANAATLAGHVEIQDGATIGAFSGIHQFCRVGREAFIGGYSVITQDALPFCLSVGNRAEGHGPNITGLKRRGYPETTIAAFKQAYRTIFRSKKQRTEALDEVAGQSGSIPEIAFFLDFIRTSERGVIG